MLFKIHVTCLKTTRSWRSVFLPFYKGTRKKVSEDKKNLSVKVYFRSRKWSEKYSYFPQRFKNWQFLCSESTSQHLKALTFYPRRRSLMITALQFWLSASGKTNRAGVCLLVGYSPQRWHRKRCRCEDFCLPPYRGNERDPGRHWDFYIDSDITEVLLIHKIPLSRQFISFHWNHWFCKTKFGFRATDCHQEKFHASPNFLFTFIYKYSWVFLFSLLTQNYFISNFFPPY